MRAFYQKYFGINENERISDRKMLNRIIMTVIVVVVCLGLMSMTALAFFSSSVKTGENVVSSATFYVTATVNDITETTPTPVNVVGNHYQKSVTLPASNTVKTYEFKLEKAADADADTGYCIIKIGDKTYYTKQLGTGLLEGETPVDRPSITFKLKIQNSSSQTVEIDSCWGTYSGTPVLAENEEINLTTNP